MAPFTGIGTQLQRGDDSSPQLFVKINGITSIAFNFGTKAQIDVTDLANTSGYADYIGGLKEGGTVTVQSNYQSGDVTLKAVEDDFNEGNQIPREWHVYFPQDDGSPNVTYGFLAYVQDFGLPTIQPKDAVKANFTLKISGAIARV